MTERFQLCYITDRRALGSRPLLPLIFQAIDAGIDFIQIRENDLGGREVAELAEAAVARASGTGTRVVINDRLGAALAVGADGVHLGWASPPASAVRAKVPPGFLVGVSCHAVTEALRAEGADYIVFGPIFETSSKVRYGPPVGLEQLAAVASQTSVPVFAVGGITPERVELCRKCGAKGVAAISMFQSALSMQHLVPKLRAEGA